MGIKETWAFGWREEESIHRDQVLGKGKIACQGLKKQTQKMKSMVIGMEREDTNDERFGLLRRRSTPESMQQKTSKRSTNKTK
jgi:hypothetical protein